MKNGQLVHRLSRRIRVVAPALIKEQERCYILEILLRKHPAIKDVRIVPEIGSLVIQYDPANLPEARLRATLDAILGNLVEMKAGFLSKPEGKAFEFAPHEVKDPVILGYGTGAAMRKQDKQLMTDFNAALKAIHAQGTYKKIADKYFDFDVYGK